jgi:hypothetical protein
LLSSVLRLGGYSWAFLRREPREIPAALVTNLRHEQMERLLHVFLNKNR